MKLLLDHGAKVDQRGNDGEIPLHVACHQGTIEAVRFLVDRGAHVNAEGGRFGTPIVAAAARGDALPFLIFLMDKGANINHHAGEYESALQAHCHGSACQVESLRFLLQHCADINEKGGNHGAALIASCAHPWGEECAK